jgi:hypothetical protein
MSQTGGASSWFNPGTHAEQWLIRAPSNAIGVINAVPFYNRQDA